MIHPSALAGSVVLGRVQAVTDPDNLARVEVRFPLHVDEESNASTAWAPVATSFAGDNHGAFMLPGVGDVVVLSFVGGDTRQPIVLGAIWNGEESPSETVGGDNTDRWVITSRAGTRIAIIEESGGQPLVEITTPAGPMITLSDEGGGKIDLSTGGSTISMTPSAISIKARRSS